MTKYKIEFRQIAEDLYEKPEFKWPSIAFAILAYGNNWFASKVGGFDSHQAHTVLGLVALAIASLIAGLATLAFVVVAKQAYRKLTEEYISEGDK